MFPYQTLGILFLTLQMKDSYELHDVTHICHNFDLVQQAVSQGCLIRHLVQKYDTWQLCLTTIFFALQCIQQRTQGVVLKYCNFKGYDECILLMYPKGDVLFLCQYVIIVIGHHRVMRQSLHCKSSQQYPNEYNIRVCAQRWFHFLVPFYKSRTYV